MGGNHVNITGNGNETVVDSTIGSLGARGNTSCGEPTVVALKELAAFVQAERNQAASAAFASMTAALARPAAEPQVAQSHWRQLVALLPAIMQLPATLTLVRQLFPD